MTDTDTLIFKPVATHTIELQRAVQTDENDVEHEHYRALVEDRVFPAPTAREALGLAAQDLASTAG